MKDSNIEWTDHTFNPWEGCTKVSPGCVNCYAEARNQRFSAGKNWGKGAPRRRTKTWGEPLKWNREAPNLTEKLNTGTPLHYQPRVFCASLADWLDDEVPIEWLADLLKLIHDTPNLDWLLLTKRPENWKSRITECRNHLTVNDFETALWLNDWLPTEATGGVYQRGRQATTSHPALPGDPPANVWIGTTVEDQQRADERIPELLKIPARVRFLSCEPLLETVKLPIAINYECQFKYLGSNGAEVHWVICGGESGRGKRAFNPDWARSLRDQCAGAGVAFFMKQLDKVQPIPDDLMIRQFPTPEPAHV